MLQEEISEVDLLQLLLGPSLCPLGKWGSYVMENSEEERSRNLLAPTEEEPVFGVLSQDPASVGATLGSGEYRCERVFRTWFSLGKLVTEVE